MVSNAESKGYDKLAKSKDGIPSAKQDQSNMSTLRKALESIGKAPEKSTKRNSLHSLAKAVVEAAVDLLKQDKNNTSLLVQYLGDTSKESKMDDCVRWHLLMEVVEFDESRDYGTMEAQVQLSKMLIEPRPYLAFECPHDSDKSNKIYQLSCKYAEMHRCVGKSEKTPFLVAAQEGNAKVVAAMISSGRKFEEMSRNVGPGADKPPHRPMFPKGWSLVKILQHHPRRNDTALTAAARADHGSVDTVKELLKVDGIGWIKKGVQKKVPDSAFSSVLEWGRADVLDELLKNQALAEELVTIDFISQAIRHLGEHDDVVKGDETSPDHRLRIVKRLIRLAKKSETFNRNIVEMIIEQGSMDAFNDLPEDFMTGELKDCLLHLAVMYRNIHFVRSFIDKDPASMTKEVVVFQGDEKRYPLWYNNHVRGDVKWKRVDLGSPPDKERTDIRDMIVTSMIRMVTDMEQLSDIVYKSDVRDVCFDMSHINSASYRVSDVVDSMIRQNQSQKHLNYEKTLRYAEFPPLDMLSDERETFKESSHLKHPHTEVFRILDWLREKKNVDIIIELRVPDRLINPHDDKEMADWVNKFQVTVLDWRVLDLSISVLDKDTKDRIEKLHLYSSGNRAVVSHWFSSEGLRLLPKETCTLERCKAMISEIGKESNNLRSLRTDLRVTYTPAAWYPTPKLADLSELLSTKVSDMKGVFKPTKVAILDNGILSIPHISRHASGVTGSSYDEEKPGTNTHGGAPDKPDDSNPELDSTAEDAEDSRSLWKRIKEGRSFVDANSKHSPWYFASNAHGTQMANLICAIDPFCEIYVARVAEDAFGITPKRVEKAIAWAVSKNVDIISMSFTLGETTAGLVKQVNSASNMGIVMTCSTHDEGYRVDKAFPAHLRGGSLSLLVLAACDRYGRILRETREDTYDYLIRGKDVPAGVIPFLKSEDTITGSSVATALATALCSLILTCDRLAHPNQTYKSKEENSRYDLITKHLESMKSHKESKFILLEKFGKIDELGARWAGNPGADIVLKESFGMDDSGPVDRSH
ncbi:hypothetical protein FALBO_12951 [Fusarium albosuccineum]|uniref:Peptidase S8/S53 domain-containing protein n=1 Tax=Fusarium albosuccineum TaxID=1237068 RepID=A0A8H4P5U8_9HYPO|nr:hypothetical protein FALBO_12951 [Fusarium albosuccineum]